MSGNKIQDAYIEIAFLSAIIFSISLYIYVIIGFIDILKNKKTSKYKVKKLYKIIIFSSTISLISEIYFFIKSYDDIKENNTQAAIDFYYANTLTLLAQSIRINTLTKYPEKILGAEDFQ